MKHDVWMNDLFWGRNSNLSQCTHAFVLCDLCNDCTCENVACGRSVYTSRQLPGHSVSGKRKSISELKKITTVQSRMRIAKNSNFCSTSNRRAVPIESMKTKMLDAAGFPVTSKDQTSILFDDRLDNHISQVLRIVGFFVVLIVVQDE